MLNAMRKPKLKKKNMNYDVHIEDVDGFTPGNDSGHPHK
jgi:hypothetical protein